jgi:hypothetical protein
MYLRKVRKSNKLFKSANLRFCDWRNLLYLQSANPLANSKNDIYICMYCMTAINKCPSIKSDSVERWRGEDLSGKYWPVKWASQRGRSSTVVSGNRR